MAGGKVVILAGGRDIILLMQMVFYV